MEFNLLAWWFKKGSQVVCVSVCVCMYVCVRVCKKERKRVQYRVCMAGLKVCLHPEQITPFSPPSCYSHWGASVFWYVQTVKSIIFDLLTYIALLQRTCSTCHYPNVPFVSNHGSLLVKDKMGSVTQIKHTLCNRNAQTRITVLFDLMVCLLVLQ